MSSRKKIKDYDMPYLWAARKIIDENPKVHFKITDLAQKVGLNEFKLKRGFREVFKKGVHEYRLALKLENAKVMLEQTDMSVSEIAYAVGFESRDGFSNAFKKEFKESPRNWRNKLDAARPVMLYEISRNCI